MNKKFIITMCICFCAIAALGSTSFYLKQDEHKQGGAKVISEVKVTELNNNDGSEANAGDRVAEGEEQASSFEGNMVDVAGGVTKEDESRQNISDKNKDGDLALNNEENSNKAGSDDGSDNNNGSKTDGKNKVEKSADNSSKAGSRDVNTNAEVESTTGKDGYIGYLSEAANNAIKKLEFGSNSSLMWPVEGNVLMEYNMDNTVYFPTLNEYKTNDALIIQTKQYAPVVSAAKGVVTAIDCEDKTGVFVKMSIGNGYEIKYAQVINPVVEVGDVVDAGETIACVNDPTRFFTKEGYNLNLSMKKNGKPVDPMDYMVVNE